MYVTLAPPPPVFYLLDVFVSHELSIFSPHRCLRLRAQPWSTDNLQRLRVAGSRAAAVAAAAAAAAAALLSHPNVAVLAVGGGRGAPASHRVDHPSLSERSPSMGRSGCRLRYSFILDLELRWSACCRLDFLAAFLGGRTVCDAAGPGGVRYRLLAVRQTGRSRFSTVRTPV